MQVQKQPGYNYNMQKHRLHSRKFFWALHQTAQDGFAFAQEVLSPNSLEALHREALLFQTKDSHGTKNSINNSLDKELGQNFYALSDYGAASSLSQAFVLLTKDSKYPSLNRWIPTQVCYQFGSDNNQDILFGQDCQNNQLLTLSITIRGFAKVDLYQKSDFKDKFPTTMPTCHYLAKPGSLFFLRGPGFSNGEQIIPTIKPLEKDYLALGLRMYPNAVD